MNALDPPSAEWEQRLAQVWASADTYAEEDLVAAIDELTAELPAGHPVSSFERGGARDATGHSDRPGRRERSHPDPGAGRRQR